MVVRICPCLNPRICDCHLIWKSIFADIIKALEVQSIRIFWVGPKSNDNYSHKRRTEERHTGRRGGRVKTKVEIGIL